MNPSPPDRLTRPEVAVLGVPYDTGSSFLRGPAEAPAAIHAALHCDSTNLSTERGLDLGADERWRWVGALDLTKEPDAHAAIEKGVEELLRQDLRVVCLGGDHSVTWPILRAQSRAFPGLQVLHLDAHPDLYDSLDGDRASHACPFARSLEEGLIDRLVQVGIRTMNPHQRSQAERFGVEVIDMQQFHHEGLDAVPAFDGPLYLSIDLDALDPAFAPGVSHHEPGGLSTRDLLEVVQRVKGNLVGADVVELNPTRDIHDMTAFVAAKVLKEILDRLLAVSKP